MAQIVAADIAANPVQIGLFCAQTVVLQPQSAANFVQQPWPTRLRIGTAYDCGLTGILHRDVSLSDNALNVATSTLPGHHFKPLIRVGKFQLTDP
jgi:hypothetical protein